MRMISCDDCGKNMLPHLQWHGPGNGFVMPGRCPDCGGTEFMVEDVPDAEAQSPDTGHAYKVIQGDGGRNEEAMERTRLHGNVHYLPYSGSRIRGLMEELKTMTDNGEIMSMAVAITHNSGKLMSTYIPSDDDPTPFVIIGLLEELKQQIMETILYAEGRIHDEEGTE